MTEKKMNRRKFMTDGSKALLGAGLALNANLSANTPKTKPATVVEVFHPNAVSTDRKVNPDITRNMLATGMKKFTGSNSPWSRFLKPTDRVGLKINCLGRPLLFTHHELVQALVAELTAFGIKENNIIIWDRFEKHLTDSRYEINRSDKGVKCYGTETKDKKLFDPDLVYKSETDNPDRRDKGSTISRISSIFTKECDKIINVAILKDHGYAGVTLCLKNLAYGLSNNNGRFHGPDHIGPFIADFCALPMVKEKTVLHIIDGLEGCFENGPVPATKEVLFTPKTLWIGTDPVALDTIGFNVINAKRKEKKLPPLEKTNRSTNHITLAAEKGLGTNDIKQIQIQKVKLD